MYIGPKAILKKINKDKKNKNINLSFIVSTLKNSGLSKPHKKRKRGGSVYQRYPKNSINKIGNIIVEIDFVQRFIKGQAKPVHFISFSCKTIKLRQYKRISAQTIVNAQKEINWFCEKIFIPDVIKMDNDTAFIGSASAKRRISKTVKFLFDKKIISIFTNPRSPWNNGSVEGSNSVFSKNFWNKFTFNSVRDLDKKLKWFNKSSLEYSDYYEKNIKQNLNKKFIPQIYFIRKSYENIQTNKCQINILGEDIDLPIGYLKLYTLSKWNLKNEMLYIYFENEQKKILIKKLKFKINGSCEI